jgi:protein gp37
MKADWVYSIQDKCEDSGVPFFFKQWGGVRKHLTGRTLKDVTHDAVPSKQIGVATLVPVPA